MKTRLLYILIPAAALGLGALYLTGQKTPAPEITAEAPAPQPEPEPEVVKKAAPKPDVRSIIPVQTEPPPAPAEKPIVVQAEAPPPAPEPAPAPKPAPKPVPKKPNYSRYWKAQEQRFTGMMDRLNKEMNPQRRADLIRALSQYVRVDTLAALDWAASLKSPDEQRAALEAINKNALTGIGARIEVDSTGLPKIRNTTILSAVESTGQVESGDYISGVVKPDGSIVYFHGLPVQQIVKHLRGQAGSEIQLLMERFSPGGQHTSFDVPVQRSLIVMQPPQ